MKRYYNHDEVRQWMQDNNQHLLYINADDKNIFVKKRYGLGWIVNLGNPWILRILVGIVVIALIRLFVSFLIVRF